MIIGINTLSVVPNRIGGGETYLVNLIESLAKIDKANTYYLFVAHYNEDIFKISQNNFKIIKCGLMKSNTIQRMIYEQTSVVHLTNKYRLDILHSPANYLPLLNNKINVLTMQHLINYYHPRFFPLWKRSVYNFLVKRSCLKADHIIAISDSTKSQINKYMDVPLDKITCVYHGKNSIFRRYEQEIVRKQLQELFGIKDDYILVISTKSPQKNPIEVIRSFAYLKSEYEKPIKLVQVGLKSQFHEKMIREAKEYKLMEDIINLGYVTQEKMPILYNGAQVLLFPSIGEDFGLPLVEAMACGCPVITSNIYAPPEIVGDAGLIVNPNDFRETGEAIYSILENDVLREELIKKGLERAKIFSWEKTAKQTLSVYEEVYKNL